MVSSANDAPTLDELQGAAEPVWLWDAARRRVVWSNAAGLRFFGSETLFDLIDRRFNPGEQGVARVTELAQKLEPGESADELLQFPSSIDGEALRANCYVHALPDGRNGILVVGKSEDELEPDPISETEILDALPLALVLVSPSGQVLQTNPAVSDLFELQDKPSLRDLLADEDLAGDIVQRSLSAGTLSQIKPIKSKYGLRDIRLYSHVMGTAASRQLLVMMEDVTDRRALERRLREHAEHLSDFVASAADFTWELDQNLVLIHVSEGFEQVTGLAADQVTNIAWRTVCDRHGIDADGDIARLISERSAWKAEVKWIVDAGAGKSIPMILSAVPVELPDGTFAGYRGIGAGLARDAAEPVALSNLLPATPTTSDDGEEDNAAASEAGAKDVFNFEDPSTADLAVSEEHGEPEELSADDDVLNVTGSTSAELFPNDASGPASKTAEVSGGAARFAGDDGITPLNEADITEQEESDKAPHASEDLQGENGSPGQSAHLLLSESALVAPLKDEEVDDGEDGLSPAERSTFNEIGETIAREATPAPGEEHNASHKDEDDGTGELETPAEDMDLTPTAPGDGTPAAAPSTSFGENQQNPVSLPLATGATSDGIYASEGADNLSEEDDEQDDEEFSLNELAIESVKDVLDGLPNALVVHRDGTVLHLNPLAASLLGFENRESALEDNRLLTLFGVYADDLMTPGAEPVTFTSAPYQSGPARLTAVASALSWPDGDAVQITLEASGDVLTSEPQDDSGEATSPLPDNVVRLVRDEIEAGQHVDGPTNADLLAMLNTATDGIMTLDDQGRVLALNNSAEAMFGYENDEVRGKLLNEFLTRDSQDSLERYMAAVSDTGIASVLNDGREVTGIEKNGGEIPLFLTLGKLDGTPDGEPARLCAVLRDLTSWKKTEAELVEAREAAELASAQKSEFLANISHEIRTPLNAILGFSEVMKARRFGEIDNVKYSAYVNDIHSSGEHLLSLINDLLDLSKVEAGKLELNFASVDLGEVISQSVNLLAETAKDARVIVRSSVSETLPNVVADQRSMRQIMLNLLSNAIKFTDAGGQVLVSARLENDGHVSIKVKDTGRGMTEEQIARALEPFRQVEEVSDQKDPGTGLGLPLTKALAEANRAAFSISSEPQVGTIVEISFPTTRVLAE